MQPAHGVLQVVDKRMAATERDRWVQIFWDDLTQLELTPADHIIPLRDQRQDDLLHGLEVQIPQPEQVRLWVQAIGDRLDTDAVTVRLTCTMERLRVQIQTASPEEMRGFAPLVDMILPARQIFQARAETYAAREGEFSPVEAENLELLCYQLDLDPEVAEYIKERALGPYRDRQTKLDKYREVLNAELDRRSPPLPETTQAELDRLRAALGLSPEDVAAVYEEEMAHRQPPPPEEPEDTAPAPVEPPPVVMPPDYEELYREEFAGTIARSLYPSEFDRGRLEQARRTWNLDRERVRAIERDVTDHRYGPIDSTLGLDYTRLRYLLWLQQWAAADQETERLILSALSRDMRPLSEDAVISLHQYCVDVATLDQLWSHHSQGKFGFVAQHQVYVQADRDPEGFLAAVAWVEAMGIGTVNLGLRGKAYRDLEFDLQAPDGHLPTWRWAANSLEGDYALSPPLVKRVFQDLIEKCFPELPKTASKLLPPEAEEEPS